MVIGLELQNLQTVLAGLKQVSSAVSAINGTITKGAKAGGILIQSATINTLLITGGNITINQRGGGGGRGSSPRSVRTPPTFFEKFKSMLMSSRFGSGGLMPLVSKAVDLLGFEAVAAATAIKFLWMAANEAADNLREFRGAGYTSGGTGSEVAGLQTYGSVLGKSVQDMADLSRSLNREISSNGVAMGFANNIGMKFNFEPFGQQDMAKNLLDNIKAIRAADKQIGRTATVQALRAIGAAGEALIPMLDIPEKMIADMQRAQALSETVNSPRAIQEATEFNTQLGILGQNFSTLKTALGSGILPVVTVLTEWFNILMVGLILFAHVANMIPTPLKMITAALQILYDMLNGSGFKAILDDLRKAIDPNFVAKDKNTDALNAATDATNANTSAIRGMIGGGENARRALPAAYQQNGGQSNNWIGNAQSLGGMGF